MLLGVGADDTFVYFDLWRKSLKDNRGADLHFLVQETLHHATITMLVTSVTTAGSLYASIISDITMVRCLGLFAGTSIMMNFLLTLTLLPAVIIVQHKFTTWYGNKFGNDDSESKCTRCCDIMDKLRSACLKPLHMIFKKVLPVVILKLRYIWIILFLALGIGGALVVFKYPGLQLPSTESFQVLETDSYLEQWDRTYKDLFAFSDIDQHRMSNFVIFGVEAVDNGNPWDPDDRGSLVFDGSFQFSTNEHQEWMLQFCNDLRQQDFYNDEISHCFIESLKDYMENTPCVDPFTGEDRSPCCNENSFPYEKFVLNTCLKKCSDAYACSSGFQVHPDDDRLTAVWIQFSSDIYSTLVFEEIDTYWNTVNGWVTEKVNDAPSSLKGGWVISAWEVDFYDLQRSLGYGTPVALGVTFAIVLTILLCTVLNIVIAFFAVVAVASAVFVTIATLVLLGWELNVFESVILIMAIGLCVDFTIHYGVAYRLAPKIYTTRDKRTKFSIHTMLGAITVAALSTFLAGVFMLAAAVNAYLQLGLFLTLVMSVSWSFSTFFFQSLCRTFGPQSNFGDLTSVGWCCSIFKKCSEHKVHDKDQYLVKSQRENDDRFSRSQPPLSDMQSYHNAMFDEDMDRTQSRLSVNGTVYAVRNPSHQRLRRLNYPLNQRAMPGSTSTLTYQGRPPSHIGNGTFSSLNSARNTSTIRTVYNPVHKHSGRLSSYYVGRR